MQCALCNAEFCWLCLKQINELHYLRLFYFCFFKYNFLFFKPNRLYILGKKALDTKKEAFMANWYFNWCAIRNCFNCWISCSRHYLWCSYMYWKVFFWSFLNQNIFFFNFRKTYQRFSNLSRTKRQLVIFNFLFFWNFF